MTAEYYSYEELEILAMALRLDPDDGIVCGRPACYATASLILPWIPLCRVCMDATVSDPSQVCFYNIPAGWIGPDHDEWMTLYDARLAVVAARGVCRNDVLDDALDAAVTRIVDEELVALGCVP